MWYALEQRSELTEVYLGIDPGRDKTGLALVAADGSVLRVEVVLTETLEQALRTRLGVIREKELRLEAVIMGDGTTSGEKEAMLARVFPGVPVHLVDEYNTTMEGRELYWEMNPPRGWRRLIPLGLQVPPVPLDGYAAIVQVRRFLAAGRASC